MPRLKWDQVGERRYETGVDRGVLYVQSDGMVLQQLLSLRLEQRLLLCMQTT